MFRVAQVWWMLLVIFAFLAFPANAAGAAKAHVITFGKWTTVHDIADSAAATEADKLPTLKIRSLSVDARIKEFTFGAAHDVTDRVFVVQRAFRINDNLPQDPAATPHWQWQRGGWLLVDRATGRISPVNLPEFDSAYSVVSWYRDYAAYCGLSDDGKEIYAMVAQVGRRKPLVKWQIGEVKSAVESQEGEVPDSACKVTEWQRAPTRVTFEPGPSSSPSPSLQLTRTYVVHRHAVDLLNDEGDD
ncbi:MAG TPA: hypothetical protein VMF10_09965 [Candidatus Aquilonibacter sp.]|nr:hypothetical protein [Candidatus Aquilonibacter sp.]